MSTAKAIAKLLGRKAQAEKIRALRARARPVAATDPSRLPLLDFIKVISPRYDPPRHLGPLLELLDQAERGPVRGVVSVPPRHGKTETLLHAFARRLRQRPWETIAYASYAADVAHSKSRLARDYAIKAGVQLRGDSAAVHEWRTPAGGGMLATGIGGPLTSHGAHLLVVDDPFANRQEAESAIVRQHVHEWFTSTAMTRVEPGGSVLVVHTRWHGDDLAGRLGQGITPDRQPSEKWPVVNLPAISDAGAALWPERWPADALSRKRAEVGEYDWWSLFQGQPRPRGGAIFGDPGRYSDSNLKDARLVIGVDPAASEKTHADYSVAVVLAITGRGSEMRADVLEVVRGQWEIPRLVSVLRELQARYQRAPLVVEAVGGFRAVPQMLRSVDPKLRVTEVQPATDKFIRAQPVAAAWNGGRVRVPFAGPWVASFLDELQSFTGIRDPHDDQVDALAHAWNYAAARGVAGASDGSVLDL